MASAILLKQLYQQVFAVRKREFRQCIYCPLAPFASDNLYVIVCTQGPEHLLLNSCTFGDFLIDDFECDVVYLERHVGRVIQLCMEIEQAVVYVKSAQ